MPSIRALHSCTVLEARWTFGFPHFGLVYRYPSLGSLSACDPLVRAVYIPVAISFLCVRVQVGNSRGRSIGIRVRPSSVVVAGDWIVQIQHHVYIASACAHGGQASLGSSFVFGSSCWVAAYWGLACQIVFVRSLGQLLRPHRHADSTGPSARLVNWTAMGLTKRPPPDRANVDGDPTPLARYPPSPDTGSSSIYDQNCHFFPEPPAYCIPRPTVQIASAHAISKVRGAHATWPPRRRETQGRER